MYFPYFFGRRAELSAIGQSATRLGTPQRILPVVEPVVDKPGDMLRMLDGLAGANAACYLIVNPARGKLAAASSRASWTTALAGRVAQPALVRPTLLEQPSTTVPDLQNFAAQHSTRPAGLVLASNRLPPADVATAAHSADLVVFLLPGVNPVPYNAAVGTSGVVIVSDNFAGRARNADYSGEEWLTNNHLDYLTTGQAGFADYTVLPPTFSLTGGPVGAAAIHLTFEHPNTSFWVQHFTSDETDPNIGNASTKLLEAIAHMEAQLAATPTRFALSPAIVDYQAQAATGHATNLTKNKQLQIMHHLFTVGTHRGV
jgi:hypothetical protein